MYEFYATFDYTGITDPESGSEYDIEYIAYEQWEREFLCATREWGDDSRPGHPPNALLGYRICSRRNETDWRVSVRFLVADTLTVEEQVETLQSVLFDEGCLSGGFVIGRERPFLITHEVTREVWAMSPEQASARVVNTIIRIERE